MNDQTGFGLRTRMTGQYGMRIEAESFILRRWEPADETTREGLRELAEALGVALRGADKQVKVIRCLSDISMALKSSPNGLIAWPTGSCEMMGRPYGRDVAVEIKGALERSGLLARCQKSSKRDGLAAVYRISRTISLPKYKFKPHRDYAPVEIRSGKRREGGQKLGGVALGRRRFIGAIEPFEEQVFRINDAMAKSPLVRPDGTEYSCGRRIFNGGSLLIGGRFHGSWQQLKESERLLLRIQTESVCEIDIKACFLSIAFAKFGSGKLHQDDPYCAVPFVYECNDKNRHKTMREVCKRLIVAFLCKDGNLTCYPKLDIKDPHTGKVVPFKKRFQLRQPVSFYMDQIKSEFPFLQQQKDQGADLMFQESNIIVDSMLRLLDQDIVSYPVHDCLIVKFKDKELAIEALSESMNKYLSYVPVFDMSYLDSSGTTITQIIKPTPIVKLNNIVEEDFEILEDF